MQFFLAICFFLGCFSLANAQIAVAATTSFVRDLVEQIGGEEVAVTALMGPGIDPHLYKASIKDLKTLRSADIIFYNGLHLEGRMTEALEAMKKSHPACAVTEEIPKDRLIALTDDQKLHDPHVWFNPDLWAICAKTVAHTLIKQDSQNKEKYEKNLQIYLKKLEALHQWSIKELEKLPKNQRILITSHDAYNYFGKAYDFHVIGVQGISTSSEAGLADIISTIDYIKKHKIKAIFVESSVSPATIERIAQQSGAEIGGQLFSDSLGDGPLTKTYIGTFKHNLNTIITHLQ